MSAAGAALALLLVVAGSLLLWAHAFVNTEVHTQLAETADLLPGEGQPGADR